MQAWYYICSSAAYLLIESVSYISSLLVLNITD